MASRSECQLTVVGKVLHSKVSCSTPSVDLTEVYIMANVTPVSQLQSLITIWPVQNYTLAGDWLVVVECRFRV